MKGILALFLACLSFYRCEVAVGVGESVKKDDQRTGKKRPLDCDPPGEPCYPDRAKQEIRNKRSH